MAISAQNEYYKVWQDFIDGKYTLCITNDIIEEYSEVIARIFHRWFQIMSLRLYWIAKIYAVFLQLMPFIL